MFEPNEENIRKFLTRFPDPETGRPLGKQIRSVAVDIHSIRIEIGLTSFAAPL
jgi:hypothetical protein